MLRRSISTIDFERYEQTACTGAHSVDMHGGWCCSPSYLGQWSFTAPASREKTSSRWNYGSLYKGVPDRETLYAHAHALDPEIVKQRDLAEEHIVSKVDRFLEQMLSLGENLLWLGAALGIETG